MPDLETILRVAVERNATDVHIQVGRPPVLRIDRELVPLEEGALDAARVERLLSSVMAEPQQQRYRERLDVDFSYGIPGLARFRVNVFRERGAMAGAFRRIPLEIPTPETLRLPR